MIICFLIAVVNGCILLLTSRKVITRVSDICEIGIYIIIPARQCAFVCLGGAWFFPVHAVSIFEGLRILSINRHIVASWTFFGSGCLPQLDWKSEAPIILIYTGLCKEV